MNQHNVEVAFIPSCPIPPNVPTIRQCGLYLRYIPYRYPHYFHHISGTFEDFLRDQISRNRRKKFKKVLRRFVAEFGAPLHWKTYQSTDEIDDFISLAYPLSALTYQAQWLGLGLPDTDTFRQQLRQWAHHRQVRGYILFAHEKPIAFLCYPILQNNILQGAYGGYHPDFKEWSPGTILDYLVLESLYQDKKRTIQILDFTQGEGEHKRTFSNQHIQAGDVYFFAPPRKYLALTLRHQLFQKSYQTCNQFLKTHQLDTKVRQFLRYGRLF